MLSRNDAEQVVHSVINGATADTDMAVVTKSFSFTLADGAADFDLGDKITFELTKNPPAAGAAVYESGNTGDGTRGSVTLVGEVPEETITLKCIAEAANAGTFSVEGSKSGKMSNLTVAVAYTHVYQQIEPGDQILSAMVLADSWAAPSDDQNNITVYSGKIQSATDLSSASLFLVWRDLTSG